MKTKHKLLVALIVVLFAAAAIGSIFVIDSVSINYNLADYLQEDTDTKKALGLMEEQFGLTTDLKVMIPDISWEDALAVQTSLMKLTMKRK